MGLLAAFVAMLVLGAGTAYAVMEPVSLIGVSGDALASSLNDEEQTSDQSFTTDTRCAPSAASDVWRCSVPADDSGNARDYMVSVDDEGCWEAGKLRQSGKTAPSSSLTRGCIGFLDAAGLSTN